MLYIVTILVFASMFMFGLGLGMIIFAKQRARAAATSRRLGALTPSKAKQVDGISLFRDKTQSTIPLLDRLLRRLPNLSDVQLLLHQAGKPFNTGVLVLLCATMTCVGLAVGTLQDQALVALAMGLLLGYTPIGWVKMLKKRRLNAFDEQFPDAVDLMARALRAGHSIGSAMRMAADEMEDPVREELAKTHEDYTYGKSLEEALDGLAWRVGLQDVKFFATAISLQRETGGRLTEILDNIGHIIRERFRLVRHVKSLSAEGRLSGWILSAMPLALLVLLYFTSPGYLNFMLEHPMGPKLLTLGAGFQVVGMLVIRWLIALKV